MYPFNVIVAGEAGPFAPRIKSELAAWGAEVEFEFPTANAVVTRFADENPPPRLLVVLGAPDGIAASVRILRDRFPSWPILAAVGNAGGLTALLAANRAGADQVVGLPMEGNDFGEAMGRLATRFRPVDHPSFVLAVSGVVPGSGATTLAAALAGEVRRATRRAPFSSKPLCEWACWACI